MTVDRRIYPGRAADKFAAMSITAKHTPRFIIAISLFLTSILISISVAVFAHRKVQYWVVARPIPQGVEIKEGDLRKAGAAFDIGINSYIRASQNPSGAITLRNLNEGEILQSSTLVSNREALTRDFVPLLIRASDFPGGAGVGDLILLYQVQDLRDGQTGAEPNLISENAFITSMDEKGSNFGSDLSITVAIPDNELKALLAATSSGRIVAVKSHG
jgi:hypothetical protein